MTESKPQSTPENRRVGYARVSSVGQSLEAQLDQLRADGCTQIYREKVGGEQATNRRELQKMLKALVSGDVAVVRDLIRTCTAEGRSRAKERGEPMGRRPSLTPQQQAEARQRREDGATLQDLAQSYNVSKATISRLRN
jgi:DNA invertase Pin-like site-specific DNA recombinase